MPTRERIPRQSQDSTPHLAGRVILLGESNEAIAELTLLLPHWQLEALERVAGCWGLTMAQLLGSLIGNCVAGLNHPGATRELHLQNGNAGRKEIR